MSTQDHKSSKRMKVRIPYALKMKFLNMEGLESNVDIVDIVIHGKAYKFPGRIAIKIKLDLSDDPDSLMCCQEWLRIIFTYFKTSYKAYRIDFGPYTDLWPTDIKDGVVTFMATDADIKRKDWRDWFTKEDYFYAPK